MNRTDRLVAMVTYLQGRRVVRAEELAAHFEISVRTVYRDVAALGEAGVPVVGEAGVGYSLVKGYHLPPVMFTVEEAMALATGEDLVKKFTDQSLAGPMTSALLKIRSVLRREHQDDLDRLASTTAVEPGWHMPSGLDRMTLLPIQRAVVTRRVLRLTYRAKDQTETERQVEPLGVVYYGDAWYLVGWCRLRQDYRHFKLVRIVALEVLPERFTPRAGFQLREHLDEAKHQATGLMVRVWFSNGALERARNESHHAFVSEASVPAGGAHITLTTSSLEWMARWLLSFGGEAEALEPIELREKVIEQARLVVEKHEPAAVY